MTRTTAQTLGQYARDLRAERIDEETVRKLVLDAGQLMHNVEGISVSESANGDEGVHLFLASLRRANPSPGVLRVIEQIEKELTGGAA